MDLDFYRWHRNGGICCVDHSYSRTKLLLEGHMKKNTATPNIHRVQLPSFRITVATYAIGLIFNYILFLAAFFDDVSLPSMSEILAMVNVSIILIITTRIYLRILFIFIG